MPLAPGTRIGAYEILSPLGAGGMGEVYRARDSKLNRDVAVKVLPEALSRDPDHYARFQREAQALAALNHPNIAAIYGLEENALIMEFVDGETLRTPLPIETALVYARQIAEALEYAHDRNIIHRDLKPANVMITREGVVKVLDFGLAKVVSAEPLAPSPNSPTLTMRATEVGLIMGTASYMSPEQASGLTVDTRADIWSFGVVLWEMLCGGMLFQGQTVSHTLADVIKGDIELSKVPAGALRDLVGRCLDRDIKNRLRDIGEARVAIAHYKPGVVAVEAKPAKFAWLPWAVAGALAASWAASFYLREKTAPPAVARFEIAAPDKHAFNNRALLSPDGRLLAFAATGEDGTSRVWIRPLDSLEARPLAGTEGAQSPVIWSPDSRSIAFSGGGLQVLKRIDLSGGSTQTLCPARGTAPIGAWSPGGVIVYQVAGAGLHRVSASGGECAPVTKLDSNRKEQLHTAPAFLPDGKHFVYLRRFPTPEDDGLYIGSLDRKPEEQDATRLLPAASGGIYVPSRNNAGIGYILFLQQSSLFARPFDPARLAFTGEALPVAEQVDTFASLPYISVSNTGVLAFRTGGGLGSAQLAWYDRSGKRISTALKLGEYSSVALSPDGTKAAIEQRREPQSDIWIHDFSRGSTARLTFNDAFDTTPVWTPDSETVVYASRRTAGNQIFWKPSSGAGDEQLLGKGLSGIPTDVSKNGRFLLYTANSPKTRSDIWVAPMRAKPDPSDKGTEFLATEHRETHGQFSPDGRYIAFASDASGRREVYVRPFSENGAAPGQWMISTDGGGQPRWSRDGKELYFISQDSKLMAASVKTAPVFQAGIPAALFRVPLGVGAGTNVGHRWDAAPDGKRFLFIAQAEESRSQPVVIVQNWEAGLAGR